MLSITQYIEEGRKADYTSAALSGLLGPYTGGGAYGQYATRKIEAAERDLAQAKGEKISFHDTDLTGSQIINAVLGSIPIVGSINNIRLAKKRWDVLDKVEQTKEKAKEIAKKSGVKIK